MPRLKSFPTIVPAVQSAKILELLEEQRDAGEIDSREEFEAALQRALLDIDSGDGSFIPIAKRVFIRQGLSSSEQFNFQLSQVRRDMDVIALELSNIQSTIKAHADLFQDKYVDQIKFSISDLKAKIDNLQVVRSNILGFEDTVSNTFADLGALLSRNEPISSELYQDLRRLVFIEDSEIALLDRNDETLTLPLLEGTTVPFLNVEIDPTNTTTTEVNIDLADSTPDNILDGELGTFWFQNILTNNILSEGAKLSLDFDLGDKKEINSLVLQSVSDFPMFIDELQYVDEFDEIRPLQTNLQDRILAGSRKFVFDTITMQRVIVRLRQFNASQLGIDLSRPTLTLDDLKRNPNIDPQVSMLADSVETNVEDPVIRDALSLSTNQDPDLEVFNHYVFAMDNAFTGRDAFAENGFFISKANEFSRLAQLSLDTAQTVPTFLNEDVGGTFNSGSIEYDLVKRDFNGKGDFISSVSLPVLPIGTTSVIDERLFFTAQRKIIPLRFTGHTTTFDASAVTVYRNNALLVRGTDWRFANRSTPGLDTDPIIATSETQTLIEILHDDNVILNGKYTVDYVPQHLSNPEAEFFFDESRTILYLPNNNIEFRIDKLFEVPETSEVYLKIAIRNNSFLDFLTPRVGFYKLFTSSL